MKLKVCILVFALIVVIGCKIETKTVYYWNKSGGPSYKLPIKKRKVEKLKIINYKDSVFPSEGITKLPLLSSIEVISAKNLIMGPLIDSIYLRRAVFNDCTFRKFPIELNNVISLNEIGFVFCGIKMLSDSINYLTRVNALDLTGNNLSSLPIEITELKSLETIILTNNSFVSIPEELLLLPNLVYIDLSNAEGEELPNQNQIDYFEEIETLKMLLKTESLVKLRIHVESKLEMDRLILEINDDSLVDKLAFHYYY
ncbi:MAG: leucine-rich repeat domain-containing protein [Bacteroidales bacterium]|nr:leucine-rich repeat domain-containing protein [Bacteroidales bacterium]